MKSIGTGKVSSKFSTAKIGAPAVTLPMTGISAISFLGKGLHCQLGLVFQLLLASFDLYVCNPSFLVL